jgi:hypothetical protein
MSCIVVSGMGNEVGPERSVSIKTRVTFHDDRATKDWFYPAMAEIISPYPAPDVESAILHLDTPLRVIIQLIPDKVIKFDGDKIAQSSQESLEART